VKLTPLHARFGMAVDDVDLRTVTQDHLYGAIREAFEKHSVLLFRGQQLDDAEHVRLARLFGPLENRDAMASGRDVDFEVSAVSNVLGEDQIADPESLHTLNLQGNMLWHTDSTFLPVPALVNLLTAKVLPSTGGETELASTRAAWADMPDAMKEPLKNAIIWHRLSHSRSKISDELARLSSMAQWPDRPWRAVWPNPVTGAEALFIASHAFAIEGMGLEEGQDLIERAIEFCTRPEFVYSHQWSVGDVLIWDERATLHRGQPWPYGEARTLKSICCSVTRDDGLDSVKIV